MQELLLLLLIVLILWPKPLLGAVKWVYQHAFGDGPPKADTGDDDTGKPEDSG